MKKGPIVIFLLSLLILNIVSAQDGGTAGAPEPTASPSPNGNGIETCLEISKCGDDQVCRAKCAGVPNPTVQQVNDTRTCVENCAPSPNYATCRDACIDVYYNPKPTFTTSTIPPSTNPSSVSIASAPTSTASSTQNNASQMPTPISSVAVKTTSFSTLLLAFMIFMTSICFSLNK